MRSHIGLPSDPAERRAHLSGLNSALQDWTPADVDAARPALEPWRSIFDQGRSVGLDMARRNTARRRALQRGVPGRVHRIDQAEADKAAKRLPELP